MRELVLLRLTEIGIVQNNFPKSDMRWRNFIYNSPNALHLHNNYLLFFGSGVHISNLMFCNLDDKELLQLYERVISRCAKQM